MKSKLEILSKATMGAKDIADYLGVSLASAYRIKKICVIQFNGAIKFRTSEITTKSFCDYLGTTREEEIKLLGGNNGRNI